MSKLSKLYQAIANLKELGLTINDDLIEEVNKLEEEFIKKEILPVLTEKIEPALALVERELVLVVDYVPNKPLSVRISRKRNFTAEIPDAKVIKIDSVVEHSSWKPKSKTIKREHATQLSVTFPDGTVIAESKATETLVKVVKKIGVLKVREVVVKEGLTFSGVPVVSNRRDEKYGKAQKELGNGWLLCTHCNNKSKQVFLEKISKALNLKLIVSVEDKV